MHPCRRSLCHSVALLAAALALPLMAAPASAGARVQNTQPSQTSARKKLAAVKQQISALARQQRTTAGRRNAINTTLASQADQLSAAARAVHASNEAITGNQQKLDALEKQRGTLKGSLDSQREALADLLRAAYKLQPGSDLRLLLGDAQVAKLSRALAYSRYFQRDRVTHIRRLLNQLDELKQVEADITHKRQVLEAALAQKQRDVAKLADARRQQQGLLAKVNAQLKGQHAQMRQLERNRQSLTQLIAKLRDAFADIPTQLPSDIPFAKRRGKLPWPVHGKIEKRSDGVDISAPRGTTVRAVAHGRVAYANWLRGYGLLIVVDHGNGWMSLYGGNETLRASVGDWVHAGQPIATAGASTGNAAGVYFGLRHDGKPVKPLPWLAKH